MINGVNFNSNIAQSYQKANAPVTHPSFEGSCEMPSEVSSAYRAYGQAMVNKPLEQLSFNECIFQLQKQGKVEGKDYRLENYERGNTAIYLINKNNQETKRILFGTDGKIDSWEDYKYANERKVKEILHHSGGIIPYYLDYYYNDEIPQEAFTKEKLTYNTTPKQYIGYLKKNNINYKIEREGQGNNKSIYITEFDENSKITQSTYWSFYDENQIISRSIYDSNEAETKRITFFDDDRTGVCTYLEKL